MTRTILTWFDLETTGLDEKAGRILEYAVVFTDLKLNEFDCRTAVIPQSLSVAKGMMDDYVVNMHSKNGLLEELESWERLTPQYDDEIGFEETELLLMLGSVRDRAIDDNEDVQFVVAGSNILFDVKWMMGHMPKFMERMDHRRVIEGPESYRCLNVSAYKIGFPEAFGSIASAESNASHRAMDDIRYSISQHAQMQELVELGMKSKASRV